MKAANNRLLTIAFTCCVAITVGCSKLSTDYGKTSGESAYSSINGYGTFRQALENAGFTDRDIARFTDRLKKSTDLVVWAPQNDMPLNAEAVAWIDSWLKQANHTLIYISPDGGSEPEYWMSTTALAPAEKRLEYRRRAATSRTQRMQIRFSASQAPSYKWFTINRLSQPENINGVKGPWTPQVKVKAAPPLTPIENAVNTAATQANIITPVPGTATTPQTSQGSAVVQPSTSQYTTRPLLKTSNGTVYVAEVTSQNWNGSRIIVVASGSLLSNFGLTQKSNRLLADKIIEEAASAKNSRRRAGFLNNNGTPLTVSNANSGAPVASGMELLTVWPVSLLTMHGVFLGFVICLMLLPIFGRPRKISHNQLGNFGHHLDAVAALMKRAGGERYARQKISDYMKRIRGETAGPWIINELVPEVSQTVHTLRPDRLSEKAAPQVPAAETLQSNAPEPPAPPMPSEGTGEPAKSQPDGKKLE